MKDQYQRTIDYMRISITDRCNLRCRYCMPEEGVEKLPMSSILTYEEILRICRQAAQLGITDFRVTGGEPLVRRGCPDLIRGLKRIPGVRRVMLTTNGQLLGESLQELLRAGLDGVNISLDSLREDRYALITRGGKLAPVLESIDRARQTRLSVKVNCVLQEGCNDDEIRDFAELAFSKGIDVRFIEVMPIGLADMGAGVSNEQVLGILQKEWPELQPDGRRHGSGPAVYRHIPGRPGAVGFISAIHGKFCGDCNRIRLTSQGKIKPCLCYGEMIDLVPALREADDEQLRRALADAARGKPQAHCFGEQGEVEGRSMVEIGG